MKAAYLYLAVSILTIGTVFGSEVKPLHKITTPELEVRLANDARTVQQNRQSLQRVICFMASRADLFPTNSVANSRIMSREEKEAVWNAWQRFLDHMLLLDSIGQYYSGFHHLRGAAKDDAFLVANGAMLARYRAALEFIQQADNNSELDKILNDAVPELGLPPGSFAKLKFKYLNVAIATEFAAQEVVRKTIPADRQSSLRKCIDEDSDYIWKTGRCKGQVLTLKNALKVLETTANTAWFPVQSGVAEWMGDVKVYRPKQSLISHQQICKIESRLEPGDVLLERREWFLSNIGLPGFWSHAALYIGTPEQRYAYFEDRETRSWVKHQEEPSGDLEWLLKTRFPDAYKKSTEGQHSGPPVRIIEAISEGVSLTTLEHSADCDSLVVLRPRLSKREKAQALFRAFRYVGRPYDFNFDFSTDSELVCTEVIYKAYEPAEGFKGLALPLTEMLGRKVTPANDIARQFDAQCGTADQQLDLVLFLDGHEKEQNAVEASIDQFRQSWRRPKWHVLVQK